MVFYVSGSRSYQLCELWLCGCEWDVGVTINYDKLPMLLRLYSNEAKNYPNTRLYFTIFIFDVLSNKQAGHDGPSSNYSSF